MKPHLNQIRESILHLNSIVDEFDKEYKYPFFQEMFVSFIKVFFYFFTVVLFLPPFLYILFYSFLTLHISTIFVFECVDLHSSPVDCVEQNLIHP